MPAIFCDRNVARRRAPGIDLPNLGQLPIGTDGIGKDLSVLLDVLGASVHHVEPGMKSRKRRVDNIMRLAFNVQEAHRTVRRVKTVHVDGMLSLCAAGTVGQPVFEWLKIQQRERKICVCICMGRMQDLFLRRSENLRFSSICIIVETVEKCT